METKYYPALWYKIDFTMGENHVDFICSKIVGLDEENISNSTFEKPELTGYIKWDGCISFEHSGHYCTIDHAKQAYGLFEEIYKYAKENLLSTDF